MLNILISLYSVYVPIGFIFLLLALDAIDKGSRLALGYLVVGIIFIVFGIVAIIKAWDEARTKESNEGKRFESLMTEVRGLRQDLTIKPPEPPITPKKGRLEQ